MISVEIWLWKCDNIYFVVNNKNNKHATFQFLWFLMDFLKGSWRRLDLFRSISALKWFFKTVYTVQMEFKVSGCQSNTKRTEFHCKKGRLKAYGCQSLNVKFKMLKFQIFFLFLKCMHFLSQKLAPHTNTHPITNYQKCTKIPSDFLHSQCAHSSQVFPVV